MIRTKDLVEFMKSKEIRTIYHEEGEYRAEIVRRLEMYDEMKTGIEKLCHDLSNGVDK